jgi:hypothetical protein
VAKTSKPAVSSDPDPASLIERVRELVQSVKGYVQLTPQWRRKINSAATLPDAFFEVGALTVDSNEWLASTAKLTHAEIHQMLESSADITLLASELELLAKGLRSTAAAQRADVGQRLLLAYAVAKQFNKMNSRDVAIPHIEKMQAMMRARRRGRVAKGEPEPEPDEQNS